MSAPGLPRLPDHAFEELLHQNVNPPGYLWTLVHLRTPPERRSEASLRRTFSILAAGQAELSRLMFSLEKDLRLLAGTEPVPREDALGVRNFCTDLLLATLVVGTADLLKDDAVARWATKAAAQRSADLTPALVEWMEAPHVALLEVVFRWLDLDMDMRLGRDPLGDLVWNPRSPAAVFGATGSLQFRVAERRARELAATVR